jgi:hypothetical protein
VLRSRRASVPLGHSGSTDVQRQRAEVTARVAGAGHRTRLPRRPENSRQLKSPKGTAQTRAGYSQRVERTTASSARSAAG